MFEAPAVVLPLFGIGKSFKVTSNSWSTPETGTRVGTAGRGNAVNMEFVNSTRRGMVWPPSVKGDARGVRGDSGCSKTRTLASCSTTHSAGVQGQYAETEERPTN